MFNRQIFIQVRMSRHLGNLTCTCFHAGEQSNRLFSRRCEGHLNTSSLAICSPIYWWPASLLT